MKRQYQKYYGERWGSYGDYNRHRIPSDQPHQGMCACGTVTSRMGYSSAEPWVCKECAEKALRATYDRAMKTNG